MRFSAHYLHRLLTNNSLDTPYSKKSQQFDEHQLTLIKILPMSMKKYTYADISRSVLIKSDPFRCIILALST